VKKMVVGGMTSHDETSLSASFMTAVLHVVIFAALHALLTYLNVPIADLGVAGYIALLFIAVFTAAASYYLTTGAIGGTLLYALMISVVFIITVALLGEALSFTMSQLPATVMALLVSASAASILGIKLTGWANIGRIAAAINRYKRRQLR